MGSAGFNPKKHLYFKEIKDTGKTKVWEVQNKFSYVSIGEVKWNGAWRKYCFFPDVDTVFDTKCLEVIIQFIENRMKERRIQRKKK